MHFVVFQTLAGDLLFKFKALWHTAPFARIGTVLFKEKPSYFGGCRHGVGLFCRVNTVSLFLVLSLSSGP